MSEEPFRIGVYSTAPFVQAAMARTFAGLRTLDGRPVFAVEFSSGEQWDALLIDAAHPLIPHPC